MRRPTEPVWKGPEVDGVTQSLLGRFLVCRERFRVLVIDGLRPRDDFSHRMEYGNMWHLCEEAFASERAYFGEEVGTTLWEDNLADYCQQLCARYPLRVRDILKWVQVCAVQFPSYRRYWAEHKDTVPATNLLREKSFDVPYLLPSGRTVRLRGKWDSVDFLPAHVEGNRQYPDGVWLQENKTKGDIDPASIRRQLRMDLQTGVYLVALEQYLYSPLMDSDPDAQKFRHKVADLSHLPSDCVPVLGVRYNVVRRPLSGGRHTIVQHKATKNKNGESESDYYARLAGLIGGEPDYFFMRWKCDVSPADVERFRRTCLDPILEQLCDWYEWVTAPGDHFGEKSMQILGCDHPIECQNAVHFMMPYGVYNPLLEGGTGDVDEYLATGSEAGLRRVTNLFPELT